ncbi:hypothetical protein G7046_g5551 [Stylonectria norvegica]|nr:hypothetical protein G7046_g5551 [Stylonectria norvegica]
MLRLRPTTIGMTPGELKDFENRCRYRRYLRNNIGTSSPVTKPTRPDSQAPRDVSSQGRTSLVKASETNLETRDAANTPNRQSKRDDGTQSTEPWSGSSRHASTVLTESQDDSESTVTSDTTLPPLHSVRRGVLFRHHTISEPLSRAAAVAVVVNQTPQRVEGAGHARAPAHGVSERPMPLDLPRPFSTVPRAGSIDQRIPNEQPQSTAGLNMDIDPPWSDDGDGRRPNASSRAARIMSMVRSINVRGVRTRGSMRRSSVPDSPQPSSWMDGESLDTASESAMTPRRLPVYNDALPTIAQPQTPRHLAESRHQSRFDGAYTAPVGEHRRGNAMEFSLPAGRMVRYQRSGSPSGLRLRGFRGLYGGMENADEDSARSTFSMSSFGRQFSSSSPVLTMSPQLAHQSLGMATFTHQAPPRQFRPMPSQFASAQPTRMLNAGRKRSRDEASVNLDTPSTSAKESETSWNFGEGMVLIKSDSRYVTDASSQSGTWVEDKKAADEKTSREEQRLSNRCCKSQRTITNSDVESSPIVSTSSSPLKMDPKATTLEGPQAPVIDEFTMHLGIGWRRISDDEHIQAAARGWARFIENHYSISNVRILLESKGLESYLIESSQGFFLFAENLRQGQLVSQTVEGALRNLQCIPPHFEGSSTLVAAESPRPVDAQVGVLLPDMEMKLD